MPSYSVSPRFSRELTIWYSLSQSNRNPMKVRPCAYFKSLSHKGRSPVQLKDTVRLCKEMYPEEVPGYIRDVYLHPGAETFLAKLLLLQQVADACLQHFHLERFRYVAFSAGLIAFNLVVRCVLRCQHDDGDMIGLYVSFDLSAKFQSVHLRHHYITDDDVYRIVLKPFETFRSTLSRNYLIFLMEDMPDESA